MLALRYAKLLVCRRKRIRRKRKRRRRKENLLFLTMHIVIGCGKLFSVSSSLMARNYSTIIDKLYTMIRDKDPQVHTFSPLFPSFSNIIVGCDQFHQHIERNISFRRWNFPQPYYDPLPPLSFQRIQRLGAS